MKKINNELKIIECRCCGNFFTICKKCYRGHVYCSEQCKKAGYRERHREAQKKYQNSKKGKKTISYAASIRRNRKKKYIGVFTKLMKPCICLMMLLNITKDKKYKNEKHKKIEKCSICGKEGTLVETFIRTSYGKKN